MALWLVGSPPDTSGAGLSSSQGHCSVFLGKTLLKDTLRVPLSTQEYTCKLVLTYSMLQVTLGWTGILSRLE